ncbi:hypothetical protein BD289DRAFT_449406 [Coniella lustricola]|uniref:Microbial-type PARG catalytic domain-containing protein n=1 Tax=Coniella lustricola TaxID=2025994 RepID=A0A2T3AMJ2_9PEZI|nr:hypothetical protein BD289DRAFT_449406 [Coniella lustricola]
MSEQNGDRREHGKHPYRRPKPIQRVHGFFTGNVGGSRAQSSDSTRARPTETRRTQLKPSVCTCQLPASRKALADVAKETLAVLPFILKDLPHIQADVSEMLSYDSLPALKREDCPNHSQAIVRVINEDTYDAAINLINSTSSTSAPKAPLGSQTTSVPLTSRPAVLNLASDKIPGGGWVRGALAQEEALCYRSSLSLSLHESHYPWSPKQGLYTRDVVIFRSSLGEGHRLLAPATPAADLPVVSVVSVAAIQDPKLFTTKTAIGDSVKVFANNNDKQLTKQKMRLALRIAASRGHDRLILGALGCGAYNNPAGEIADAWVKVLTEPEFSGGWWKEVWFAIIDSKHGVNFNVFKGILDGLQI